MNKFINLFNGQKYISIKEKNTIIKEYQENYLKFKRNIFSYLFKTKRTFIKYYKNIDNYISDNNRIYINNEYNRNKKLLDNIKGYKLDNEQLKCVINEEDSCLIIAGAGSGKSLTLIAKIRYLIETKYIEEKEILCISFTKESSNKLKNELKTYYNYDIDVFTFHKLALNILKDNNIEFNIAQEDLLNYLVDEFYSTLIHQIPILEKLTIKYFFGNLNKCYEDISPNDMKVFKKTVITFIRLFKANNQYENEIYTYIKKVNKNDYILLLNIITIYNLYKIELESQNEIDFDDMIKKATNLVKNEELNKKYKYILIDEYQDTSLVRVNLIQEIINKLNCKLIVVGDDFQSIYKFSGCNINVFLDFKKYFKESNFFFITNNYRNSQELLNVAGNFIMKNKKHIKKDLNAHKHLNKPIKIIYYKNQKEAFNNLLKKIDTNNLLILGRNNNDIYKVIDNYNTLNLKYLTVHKSKGLEAENVILINLENNVMGFPSKLENHKITNLINNDIEYIKYEEERRLFYVALTRSKNYVFLLVNQIKPSQFVKEILNDYSEQIEVLSI